MNKTIETTKFECEVSENDVNIGMNYLRQFTNQVTLADRLVTLRHGYLPYTVECTLKNKDICSVMATFNFGDSKDHFELSYLDFIRCSKGYRNRYDNYKEFGYMAFNLVNQPYKMIETAETDNAIAIETIVVFESILKTTTVTVLAVVPNKIAYVWHDIATKTPHVKWLFSIPDDYFMYLN